MSSRTASKAAARERVAAMRAAQARAERRRRLLLAAGAIGLVVLLVLALVLARAAGLGSGGSSSTKSGSGSDRASAGVVKDVTNVPVSALDAVGVGTAQNAPSPIKAPALAAAGKPKVLYVGAEYCPYCAAQRWPLVVALSRFGTWSDLGASSSSSKDVFPNTATLSFHGARYTSDLLSFTGVETSGNQPVGGQYPPLDKLSAEDQKIFDTYNRPPYTSGTPGGIPFIDIAGTHVSSGASYDPGLLKGMTQQQIASALSDPTTPVAKAVLGTANVLTAVLCDVTKGQPGQVCTSPGVKAAATAIAASGKS